MDTGERKDTLESQNTRSNRSGWQITLAALRSPPCWLSSAVVVVATLAAFALAALTLVAIWHLATDLFSNDQKRISDAAKSLLPIAAAAVGLPLIVWRLLILDRQTAIADAKTQIDRETHYTSIFSRSIDQLGQTREVNEMVEVEGRSESLKKTIPNIELRLGAIFSLERLLRESEKDRRSILETLCAYIRENTPLEVIENKTGATKEVPTKQTHRKDIQAAITAIGRRPAIDRGPLDFKDTNLTGYNFSNLNFDNADFSGSFLDGSDMTSASFVNAIFAGTSLRKAMMRNASFKSATLAKCNVDAAKIEDTSFRLAKIIDTDLCSANVSSIHIEGADLENAFGYGIQFAVEYAADNELSDFRARELYALYQFFQKSTYDKDTAVSQHVRDAIDLMTKSVDERTNSAAADAS